MKKLVVPAAALALSLMTVSVGWAQAQEPADCGAATVALQTAKSDHDKAVADDDKAEAAKDADRAFERADRDLRQAQARLDRALDAMDTNNDGTVSEAEAAAASTDQRDERDSAQKAVNQATKERDRARDKADKENADQLQRVADRTDAAELKKRLDAAQDDVNRLCGGVTTTPPVAADVDCGEVSDDEAQRILNADKSDPNRLDVDGDGIACEDEVDLNPPTVNVVVPSGGVATGGGPA